LQNALFKPRIKPRFFFDMTRTIHTIILIALMNAAGCDLPESSAVIDNQIPPTIIEASIAPDIFDMGKVTTPGTTVDVTIKGYVNTSDDNGQDDIASVRFTVYSPSGKVVAAGVLLDLGVFPDASAGDGKYTSNIYLTLPKNVIGKYTIQYSSIDKDGNTSNTFNMSFRIIYSLNHAPFVTQFIIQDTIFVPTSGNEFILIQATVGDVDGLSDITSVSFSISRPEDSSVVSIFRLFDDGGKTLPEPLKIPSGDSIAGDGNYSLIMPVSSSTFRNIERYFNVFAIDQSNAVSNTISKKVYFK